MKTKFYYLLVLFLGLVGFTSCNDEYGIPSGGSIQLGSLDLTNAKYLTLSAPTTKAGEEDVEVGLFKIDEEGNVSVVVLTCTEKKKNGEVSRIRTDIKVIPEQIYALSDLYTVLVRCDFRTEDGEYFNMPYYYGVGSIFNILVRNSDGKLFYIPEEFNDYFMWQGNIQATVANNKGDIYMISTPHMESDLLMISTQGDEAFIKQINPPGIKVDYYNVELFASDNGTVLVKEPNFASVQCFYPNGGFEHFSLSNDDTRKISLSQTTQGIMAVQQVELPGTPNPERILSLHHFEIGTSVGSGYSLSEPIVSISSSTSHWSNWQSNIPIYENQKHYFLGTTLVVDKSTLQVRELSLEESLAIIFPTSQNTYNGLAWKIYTADWGTGTIVSVGPAKWFNIDTFESGTVELDFSEIRNSAAEITYQINIPGGEVIATGIRYTDGKQMVGIVNIETGKATYTVNNNDRPIATLIPLN